MTVVSSGFTVIVLQLEIHLKGSGIIIYIVLLVISHQGSIITTINTAVIIKNNVLLSQLSHKIINNYHMIQKYYNLILGNNRSCSPAGFPKSFIKMDSGKGRETSDHTCKCFYKSYLFTIIGHHISSTKWSEHTRAYFEGTQSFLFIRAVHF